MKQKERALEFAEIFDTNVVSHPQINFFLNRGHQNMWTYLNSSLLQFNAFSGPFYKSFWRCGVVVITTAQLHSAKPELKLCAGSNLLAACRGFAMVPTGNNAKCLSSVNHTTKAIHHHHHHHHHHIKCKH